MASTLKVDAAITVHDVPIGSSFRGKERFRPRRRGKEPKGRRLMTGFVRLRVMSGLVPHPSHPTIPPPLKNCPDPNCGQRLFHVSLKNEREWNHCPDKRSIYLHYFFLLSLSFYLFRSIREYDLASSLKGVNLLTFKTNIKTRYGIENISSKNKKSDYDRRKSEKELI